MDDEQLYPASSKVIDLTGVMEHTFLHVYDSVKQGANVLDKILLEVKRATESMDKEIVCSAECVPSVQFMKACYVTMRLKFQLKLHNREISENKSTKKRKNRKFVKISNS